MASRRSAPRSYLVGRDAEVARLRVLVDDPPPTGLIAVIGEAGIGKTSLVNQIATERARAGGRVLRGAAEETGTNRFGVWRRVARAFDLTMPDADPSVASADHVDDMAATFRAGLDGGDDDDAANPSPLIVLEDLHWADVSSIAVLDVLRQGLAGTDIAIVVTIRSGVTPPENLDRVLRTAETIYLRGISADDIADLAAERTGTTLDPRAASAMHRRTGGNPLFVGELLAFGGTDHVSTPTGGLLTRAVEALGPQPADTLSSLALAGPDVPTEAIADACSLNIGDIEGHLRAARKADILTAAVDGDGTIWFRHALLADAAAARYDPAAQRQLHATLAAWLAAHEHHDPDGLLRARHVLAAGSVIDAEDAAGTILATAAELRRRRRPGDAVDVLRPAVEARNTHPPAATARLWMELGEAHWDSGDKPAALEAFERAATLLEGRGTAATADIELVTSIEVARQRYHNPFIPDSPAEERLAALDRQLPDGDLRVRVPLRGRRGILALLPPTDIEMARTLTEDAVAMARRLGDAELLVTALCDRAFVIANADDLRLRGAIADEIRDLARAAGRPDLALAGHEWRIDRRLEQADLTGAVRAVEEFEAHAAIAVSSSWRYAAGIRRSVVQMLQGDRDGVIDTITAAAGEAQGFVDELELVGMQFAIRSPIVLLYGQPDAELPALTDRFAPMMSPVPSAFIQTRIAVGDLILGNHDEARRRALSWLDPQGAFGQPEPIGTLAVQAILVAAYGFSEHESSLSAALAEFSGLLAGATLGPVDFYLADLALLRGDAPAAIGYAQSALATSRVMPSPPLEARALQRLAAAQRRAGDESAAAAALASAVAIAGRWGVDLGYTWAGTTTAPPVPERVLTGTIARLARIGDTWRIDTPLGSGTLPNMAGVAHIARLVQTDGEIAAVDLNGPAEAPVANDLGPALDARAKREYRQRIEHLHAEIDQAEDWNDPARADNARRELDALIAELSRAVGLAGRDRPQGSGAERARVNVTRNIRRAITAVDAIAPALAGHLRVSVRTGQTCSYSPEPAARMGWQVDLGS